MSATPTLTRKDIEEAIAALAKLPKLEPANSIVGVGVLEVNGQAIRGVLYADGRFIPSESAPDEPLRMLKAPMRALELRLNVDPAPFVLDCPRCHGDKLPPRGSSVDYAQAQAVPRACPLCGNDGLPRKAAD